MHHAELIAVIQRLSACQDSAQILQVLREAARELTGADGVTVVLREGDHCDYVEESAIAPLWKGRRFPMETCISGWTMLHREAVAIPDIYADPRIPHDAYRPTFVKSLAMVPIRSSDPIGALGAYWRTTHQAGPEELAVMQALADSTAMAFANVQLIESLRQGTRRRDEFLSMLAHELRNPLAPIRNALHLLRQRPGDAKTVEWARDMMDRQVQHLSRLVDDLLDVARLTNGRVTLRREPVDLAPLVREQVEDRRGTLESAGLTLKLDVPPAPVWVAADPTRLAQVLGNVLDNAGKFTPPGGSVTVRLVTGPDSRAAISVRDNGIGIEPDMLARVFDVFAQADRSLERGRGGLGLGLAVAKSLVELHGGTIEATSAGNGRGTEITIRLPVSAELPAQAAPEPAAPPQRKHVRVLVVEDNKDAADTLKMILDMCGYDVTVAYGGKEGVEAAKAENPDIVLCDIGLPEMDGFAVADALRGDPETRLARLIAVSGYGDEDDRQRALAAGFEAHLVKPVDPDRLLAQLAMLKGPIH